MSLNCSTYNPCGQYGYCVDNEQGKWECQCKFWWNGTFCDQLTTNGIEVIVLGVLLGILMIIFYGVAIIRWIYRKKKEWKERIPKPNIQNPKLIDTALSNLKQSTRCSSFLTALLVLLIATLALLFKWLLIQPIHNELVQKYQQKQPIYYHRNSFCNVIDFQGFNMLTFPIAFLLILIFAILSKRTSFMRGKCKGYFAPVLPLDFYVHIKRKFAAVIFAIVADELLFIIRQVLTDNSSSNQGIISIYAIRVAKVIVVGFRYYPELSAVYLNTLFTLICASCYAWLDFGASIVYKSLCQNDFYPSDSSFAPTNGTNLIPLFRYYGIGANLILIQLAIDIPRMVCWGYVVIKLPILLLKKIRKMRREKKKDEYVHLTREEKILRYASTIDSIEMNYVRNLFRSAAQRPPSRFFLARLMPTYLYQWRDDFRFSARVLCVYSSIFLMLIFLTEQLCIFLIPGLDTLQKTIETFVNLLLSFTDRSDRTFPLPNLVRAYICAVLTALLITTIQILVLLANIRRNLLQIFRGDYSEIPRRTHSCYLQYSTGNIHFAGYFIGYLVWGYILLGIFALIIYLLLDAFILYGSFRAIEEMLKSVIPIVLLIYFKQYLNEIFARYVFLQSYGNILAINNRRMLMIFLYFNFFLDAFLGFISSMIRILTSILGGCLYMSRVDYSPLGRKLETFDAAFTAYCGFIHLEAIHRNPIVLASISYLYHRRHLSSSKARRKWHLIILLIRNPTLKGWRKHILQDQSTIILRSIHTE